MHNEVVVHDSDVAVATEASDIATTEVGVGVKLVVAGVVGCGCLLDALNGYICEFSALFAKFNIDVAGQKCQCHKYEKKSFHRS